MWITSEHHYRQDGLPKGDKQAKSKFMWELLPVDDNGVRWGLIPVTTAFLVTTPTEIEKKKKKLFQKTVPVGLQMT